MNPIFKKFMIMAALSAYIAMNAQAAGISWYISDYYYEDFHEFQLHVGGKPTMILAFWDERGTIFNALNDCSFFSATSTELEDWGVVALADFYFPQSHDYNGYGYVLDSDPAPLSNKFYTGAGIYNFFMIFISQDQQFYQYSNFMPVEFEDDFGKMMVNRYVIDGGIWLSNVYPTPEPSTALLLVAGGAVLGLRRRRKTGGAA